MLRKHKIILILGIFCLFVILGFYYMQRQSNKVESPINVDKPLSTIITISLNSNCKLYVEVNPDSIRFDPFENVCNDNTFSIQKSQYPELFKQGVTNSSFISIEKTNDPDLTLIVSNNQPDHGGYLPVYQLVVNLKTRDVKELKIKTVN